jgi:uncharacterized FlgJ-related protein
VNIIRHRIRKKARFGEQDFYLHTRRQNIGFSRACQKAFLSDNETMSATEIIEQIKDLPANERAQVTKYVVEHDDSWIPESFKQGMADAEAGRFGNMETVLSGAPPSSRK